MAEDRDTGWGSEAGVLVRDGASRYREGVVEDDPKLLDHPVLGPVIRFYHLQNPGQDQGTLSPASAAHRRQLPVVGPHRARSQPAPEHPSSA